MPATAPKQKYHIVYMEHDGQSDEGRTQSAWSELDLAHYGLPSRTGNRRVWSVYRYEEGPDEFDLFDDYETIEQAINVLFSLSVNHCYIGPGRYETQGFELDLLTKLVEIPMGLDLTEHVHRETISRRLGFKVR